MVLLGTVASLSDDDLQKTIHIYRAPAPEWGRRSAAFAGAHLDARGADRLGELLQGSLFESRQGVSTCDSCNSAIRSRTARCVAVVTISTEGLLDRGRKIRVVDVLVELGAPDCLVRRN